MDIYVIRHAEAVPVGGSIARDEDRPLTELGWGQCAAVASALRSRGVRFDQILTSRLVRARQTVEGLLRDWPSPPPVEECEVLAPGGKARKLARALREAGVESIGLVGHMPDLAAHVAYLIGSKKAQVEMEKAGVAYIECPGDPDKGAGLLHWLVTPAWCGPIPDIGERLGVGM